MNKLDALVNKYIFENKEPRKFSSKKEDQSFLIKTMRSRGYKLNQYFLKGYFYCTVEKGPIEVCSDSRHNLRPRTLMEAVCIASLKHFMKNHEEWDNLCVSLGLDPEELKRKARG